MAEEKRWEPAIQAIPAEEKQHWLSIVMEEKKHKLSEMLDYNKRLDRTVVLYLSAAYAAIGFQVSGTLNLSKALEHDSYIGLVGLFVFLNGCILVHAVSQCSWGMSLAKFVHVKLNRELRTMVATSGQNDESNVLFKGQTTPKTPSADEGKRSKEFRHADCLGWDDWDSEIKNLGNDTRGKVVLLWMVLVGASSMCSWSFVNVPMFLGDIIDLVKQHWLVGHLASLVLLIIVLALIGIYWYAIFQALCMWSYLQEFREPQISDFSTKRRKNRAISLGIALAIFAGSCIFASLPHPQTEKANSGIATSPTNGV